MVHKWARSPPAALQTLLNSTSRTTPTPKLSSRVDLTSDDLEAEENKYKKAFRGPRGKNLMMGLPRATTIRGKTIEVRVSNGFLTS
jgi:hypothetical protein